MAGHAPLLERLFTEPVEGFWELAPGGAPIPPYVRGTYYLNGPARFAFPRRDGQGEGPRYRHWLDGDGCVRSLRFDEGRVLFTSRFVASAKRGEEEKAGRPLFRAFGTAFEGDRLLRGIGLASPVNVSVQPFAGTLLAFGEQGLPWELDPLTLETRGEYTFDRALNPITPFAAHAKIDPETGELINFGVSFAADRPVLHLFRFGPGGEARPRRRLPLPYPCSLHDFAVSRRRAAFYLAPYLLNMDALRRDATLMEALEWHPERGSRLLVADRESGEALAEVPLAEPGYCLHLINAVDGDEDHLLTLDVVELTEPVYDQYQVLPDLFTAARPAHPVRYEVDLAAGRVLARRRLPYSHMSDFPALDPDLLGRPYRHFWMLGISTSERQGRKFFDQLVHLDWERNESDRMERHLYQAPPGRYLGGEPVFIPDPERPGEAGVVLCQLFEPGPNLCAFALFDAYHPAPGPLTLLPLPSPTPPGFHAVFHRDG